MIVVLLAAAAGCSSGAIGPTATAPLEHGRATRIEGDTPRGGRCERGDGERAADPGCAIPPDVPAQAGNLNVLGSALTTCSEAPLTGFRRTGRCETGPEDRGVHVVCAEMTDAFLEFTRGRGNDLSTPRPEYRFPGLRPGDRWCLCASRWAEADAAGVAPPVILEATDDAALRTLRREALEARAAR